MPVFVNEVVIRGNIERAAAPGARTQAPAAEPVNRDDIVAEVKQALMDYLERELDRTGER